jgi:hypothetical protein
MYQEDYIKYLEILELAPGASLSEIRKAYLHLMALYSKESIVTLPIIDEFPGDRKKEILRKIEEAYRGLLALFEKGVDKPEHDRGPGLARIELEETSIEIETYTGQALREIRERLNIDLQDIALSTRVQTQYLKSIELEAFDALPHEAYTRGFVISYAEYLSLDPKKVADDYMDRYRAWKAEHVNKK